MKSIFCPQDLRKTVELYLACVLSNGFLFFLWIFTLIPKRGIINYLGRKRIVCVRLDGINSGKNMETDKVE